MRHARKKGVASAATLSGCALPDLFSINRKQYSDEEGPQAFW